MSGVAPVEVIWKGQRGGPVVRTLKTSEAAALLNVSPNTLRAWERRFDYPKPDRSPGRHRLYAYTEITALRDAIGEGLSISSAVSVARQGAGVDAHALMSALLTFDGSRADYAMEASLALRPLERSIEEVLLAALENVYRRRGSTSACWAFVEEWGAQWLRRAMRLRSSALTPAAVLIGDAASALDPDRCFGIALELLCVRTGVNALSLPVHALADLDDAVSLVKPGAVIISGAAASDDDVARWAYRVRAVSGPVPFLRFRRCAGNGAAGPGELPPSVQAAHAALVSRLAA